jgi:hypothetical protein
MKNENKNTFDFEYLGKISVIELEDTFSEMEEALDVYANKQALEEAP